ncbi:MAG: glycosyltransferase family 4 protein [Candidatus Tyrphobacter sp.]
MPRALIVTQYFSPEPCAGAHRMEALAIAMRDRGMDVTVVAPLPSFPSGRIDSRYRGTFVSRDVRDGITLVRLRHIATVRRFGRIAAWLSFALLSTLYVLTSRRADVVVVTSPPISLALAGIVARFVRGSKLVVDVRDVFPDLPVQMGAWREGSIVTRLVGAIASCTYGAASLVVAVTPTAVEQVRRRAKRTPILLAVNGCDWVRPSSGVVKRRNGEFVATFTGNMGLANGMDLLLDAAKLVQDGDIRIALVGGGTDYERVAARVRSENISNVDLYGVVPRERAVGALAESDAAIIILREGIGESVPTKILDAFSVQCPVVLSAAGEARRVVTESIGGICSAPGDAESLADALRRLACDRDLARALGQAGHRYVRNFDRGAIMANLAATIERAGMPEPA